MIEISIRLMNEARALAAGDSRRDAVKRIGLRWDFWSRNPTVRRYKAE